MADYKPLAQRVWEILNRLGPEWFEYLKYAGLDLSGSGPERLAADVTRKISVDFNLPGLDDFCRTARRGVEPGDPARSLLFHVLASPSVLPKGAPDERFPLPDEIDTVENFIYSLARPSVDELRRKADGAPLAIVVFAYEYAPAIDTVHRKHADMCYSRTGISRVGEQEPRYVGHSRGFLPNSEQDLYCVHVVPCRYAAFVATKRKGNPTAIGPERFQAADSQTDFWIPLHKLYSGPECIDGTELAVALEAHHVNEKLRRVHLALAGYPENSELVVPDSLGKPPYVVTEGLAEVVSGQLLSPVPHPLVEFAMHEGSYATFRVPPGFAEYAFSMLWLHDQRMARRAPELVYAKHALIDGKLVYLPDEDSRPFPEVIKAGNYDAVHLRDHTADGWIEVRCTGLETRICETHSAYSIVAAPDFFPLVKQLDIAEWFENSAPADIKNNLWPESDTGPDPLASNRLPPNLNLKGARFDASDTTYTAIVGVDRSATPPGRLRPTRPRRESTLSYRASNIFQPGWDVSQDYFFNPETGNFDGPMHLASYGLSSPFAQDAMICAVDGAFWPGVAPDTTRLFGRGPFPSVTPIPDGAYGWDRVEPPIKKGGFLYTARLAYADYVSAIREGHFRYGIFARTDLEEYIRITLTTARVYHVLEARDLAQRAEWVVFSFRPAEPAEIRDAARRAGIEPEPVGAFRYEMLKTQKLEEVPGNPRLRRAKIDRTEILVADPAIVLKREAKGKWSAERF